MTQGRAMPRLEMLALQSASWSPRSLALRSAGSVASRSARTSLAASVRMEASFESTAAPQDQALGVGSDSLIAPQAVGIARNGLADFEPPARQFPVGSAEDARRLDRRSARPTVRRALSLRWPRRSWRSEGRPSSPALRQGAHEGRRRRNSRRRRWCRRSWA